MSKYLKQLVSFPVRALAEYLLERFLGKFVGKIDLTREGTEFNKETLTLPDLNLNCRVLNESMRNTPLKFIKFHIGSLALKVVNLRNGQVEITVRDVQIDLELQNETFVATPQTQANNGDQNKPKSQIGNSNKQKELFLVDMLVSNVLTNLELSVENLAIRVVTKEAKSVDDKIPTFLIRTHAISFSRHNDNAYGDVDSESQAKDDKKIDPLLPMSDLQCLLGNKKFAVSDISVHLMKEKWLDPLEHHKPGTFSTHFNAFSFPFEYPSLNHPSTIFVVKAPLGVRELESARMRAVRLKESHDFLPSISAQFQQARPGHLSCEVELPMAELQLTIGQLGLVHEFVTNLQLKPKPKNKDESGKGMHGGLYQEESKEPGGQDHLAGDNLTSSTVVEDVQRVKEDFADSIVSQNPELMRSMNEMFENQRQEYLMYSSVGDSCITSTHVNQAAKKQNFSFTQDAIGDYTSMPPPLIGKGDGYSPESALKDSMDPRMIDEGMSELNRQKSMDSGFTNLPPIAQLPVKQPLNVIQIGMRLGELHASLLGCSGDAEDLSTDQSEREDNLEEVIEQLRDEQGAINGNHDPYRDVHSYSESSPFSKYHDRVFKAFGEQVNRDYPMQKFHLPAIASHDESQIKSSWFEAMCRGFEIDLIITRANNDVVQKIEATGGAMDIICQRVDCILNTPTKSGSGAQTSKTGPNLMMMQSSSMDMTLLSNDSERFHSCYTGNNESSIYHDTSQFGMGSIALGDQNAKSTLEFQSFKPEHEELTALKMRQNIRNLFVFTQLTNVVEKMSQMGQFHICKSTLFEVVRLKKDTQKCFQFSSTQQIGKTAETKVFVGKIFLNLGPSEVYLALKLKQPPKLPEDTLSSPHIEQKSKDTTVAKTAIQVDGVELDFHFNVPGSKSIDMLNAMTSSSLAATGFGTVQEVLAQVPCACTSTISAKSLGVNVTQMNFIKIAEQQPCIKIKQAELVAKLPKQSPIALCTINRLLARFGPQEQCAQREPSSSLTGKDDETIVNFDYNRSQNAPNLTQIQTTDQDSTIIFRRASSSYDETRELRNSFSLVNSQSVNNIHKIDDDCNDPVSIQVGQFQFVLDHRDVVDALADFVVSLESQLKNMLNLMDTVSVMNFSQVEEQAELLLIAKKNRISQPVKVCAQIDDIVVQVLYDARPVMKLRLAKSAVEFRMQDRGLLTNFAINFKLHQVAAIDQVQLVHQYYDFKDQGKNRSAAAEASTRQYRAASRELTFQEELDQANQFLILHPSQESHARPMLACDIKLCFYNQQTMEERVSLAKLRQKLKDADGSCDRMQASRQLSMDFGEMKKNPSQVIVTGLFSHLVLPLSNSNLTLQQTLAKIADKTSKTVLKRKLLSGLADAEDAPKMVPLESPKLDKSFQKSQIQVQLRDLTVLYTPVLSRQKLESTFGVKTDQAGMNQHSADSFDLLGDTTSESDEQLFRLSCHVALHLNHLQLSVSPMDKQFELQLRSLALHYLTENSEPFFDTWRLQGINLSQLPAQDGSQRQDSSSHSCTTSHQELQRRGFCALIAFSDVHVLFKSVQLGCKLNQVALNFAEDSLHDFIAFLRLVQVAVTDDLVRLEDAIDQNSSVIQSSTGQSMLSSDPVARNQTTVYDGSNVGNQFQLHRSQLSLIKELSIVKENSCSDSDQSQVLITTGMTDQGEDCGPFGGKNPFRKSISGPQAFQPDNNDMFTVSVHKTQPPKNWASSKQNPFLPESVNLLEMLDRGYFEQPAESQLKIDQQRYRKIHVLSDQLKRMVCSLSFSFELGSLSLTLHCGRDFDFKPIVDVSEVERRIVAQTRPRTSSLACNQSAQNFGRGQVATASKILSNGFLSGTASSHHISLQKADQGSKEVMRIECLEDNYITSENLVRQDEHQSSNSRARLSHRKYNQNAKIEIRDLIVTRRHFPDQVLLDQRKEQHLSGTSSAQQVPTQGLKFKTFVLSARDFQISFSQDFRGSKYLLESPYSFRHHNMLELTVQSEKNYERNIEEHSILLFLRPSKLTVDRESIDFVDKMLKSTLAKSIERLKVNTQQKQTSAEAETEFDVIDEENQTDDGLYAQKLVSVSDSGTNEQSEKEAARTKQLIRNLVIRETSLTLSLSLNKLLSFQNLTVPIREFRLEKVPQLSQFLLVDQAPGLPIQLVQECVINFYRSDIMENQKLAIFKSFQPVKGLTYFGGSVLSPIYKPLMHGYQFGLNGFLVGLSEGFGDLYSFLAEGTYDWGVYLVQFNLY